jgi:hypothetical protein
MQGAAQRDRLTLARTARAVWVGFNATAEGLDDYIARLVDPEAEDAPQTPEQALAILGAQTATLPKLSWADALKRMH